MAAGDSDHQRSETEEGRASGNVAACAGAERRALRAIAVLLLMTQAALVGTQIDTRIEARASSAAGPEAVDRLALRLDPNRASAAELALLPNVGPTLAASIVAYRAVSSRKPAFTRAEDLDAVPRIGPKTVEALRPYLVFDP